MSQTRRVDPSRFGKVAVLMGGTSAEREISLQSGRAVLDALLAAGIDAHGLDVRSDVVDRLHRQGYDRAFIALHGRGGEDGVLQGALELLGIPYTGSGVLGSALAMDKLRCKQVWLGAGIPTPAHCSLRSAEDLGTAADRLGMPLVVKPAREGSSLGVSKVERTMDLEAAWRQALRYDDEVLAERCVQGVEYTASLLGDKPLPLIRLETPHAFYDFEAKYQARTTRYLCPCGLPQPREKPLQELAAQAFWATGAERWGRVDFLVDRDGKPWFIEVNTVPGMTDHSLVPMAARVQGIGFQELAVQILESSL
jgi:D-alanine-D-alanine ligase